MEHGESFEEALAKLAATKSVKRIVGDAPGPVPAPAQAQAEAQAPVAAASPQK